MIEPNQSISAGGKTYSPREVRALLQKLASLGINRDKIIAQINPEEAALLKRLGGSGKINPRTGLLSFDDDGGGGGDDGGGDDGGGGDEGSGGGGYGEDGGGYSGGEYDGGGSYDGYGGGWEGGSGGTYGGGDPGAGGGYGEDGGAGFGGDPSAGGDPDAGGDPGAGGGGGTGFGGGAGFGGDPDADAEDNNPDAPAFGAQETKSESRVGEGPSYGANVGPLQDAYDQMFADQVAANNAAMSAAINAGIFGGQPTEDYSAPSPTVGAMAGSGVSGAALDALGGTGFGSFGLSGVQGGAAPYGGTVASSPYDNMSMAQLDAAAQNLASQIEARGAEPQPGVTLDMPFSEGVIPGSLGPIVAPPEELGEISVEAPAPSPSWAGAAPTFSGGVGSWLGGGQNYLSEEGQSVGPFTFSGPGSGGFAPVGTNLGTSYGGNIASDTFSPFGTTAAGPYNAAAWMSSLGPDYPTQAQTPVDRNAFQQQYNASQLDPFEFGYQTNQDQGAPPLTVGSAVTPLEGPLTPPANIPFTTEEVSPVVAAPDLSGSDIYYDSGGTEPGWVEPTGLVPTVEETPRELMDREPTRPTGKPPLTETPVQNPILPRQFIDWLHYAERNNPEFGFYQTNRTPTPYAAHGGYFDADAYFADGGLVSAQGAPVQPMVASMPTMAYTDGQGLVGAIAAPPGLTPYDSYGSDVPHASPMAPAPAAAAPSFGGPLQALGARNTNAAPVPAPISQNPNLRYSLGLSGLRG